MNKEVWFHIILINIFDISIDIILPIVIRQFDLHHIFTDMYSLPLNKL